MTYRHDIKILTSRDAETGVAAVGLITLLSSIEFVTTVEINEMIFLVGGDDWLSTAEARPAIKQILSPPYWDKTEPKR